VFSAYGLCLDIIGTFFLAQGFIAKQLTSIALETQSGYGGPPNLLYVRGQISQQVEAWIGYAFLTIGFSLQLFGLAHQPQAQIVLCGSAITPLAGVVFASAAAAIIVRWVLIRWRRIQVARFLVQKAKGDSYDFWIGSIGNTLMPWLKRAEEETDQAFAQRAREQLGVCNREDR